MKHILLAKKSRRILAGLLDCLSILISSMVIFLTLVFPFSFNQKLYRANALEISNTLNESGLFFVNEDGGYIGKSTLCNNITDVESLSKITLTAWDKTHDDVNLSKDLYEFYTTKYVKYGHDANLTSEIYLNTVLKVGSEESNISNVNLDTFAISYIKEENKSITIAYFLSKYENASVMITENEKIVALKNENTGLMFSAIALIIPVIMGVGLITHFVIPLCSKTRRTLGKHIFKLDVISSDSYQLKWYILIPRYLVYILVEIIGGFLSLGGLFLITYTMFLFSKNRRSIHDFICKSVVIDGKQSIYFLNKEEEEYYAKRIKDNGTVN